MTQSGLYFDQKELLFDSFAAFFKTFFPKCVLGSCWLMVRNCWSVQLARCCHWPLQCSQFNVLLSLCQWWLPRNAPLRNLVTNCRFYLCRRSVSSRASCNSIWMRHIFSLIVSFNICAKNTFDLLQFFQNKKKSTTCLKINVTTFVCQFFELLTLES